MGWLDRLFGRGEESRAREPQPTSAGVGGQAALSDEQALARYHYMLKTAPPEAIEQAHEEAFAKLTPDQRAQVLRELSAQTPESERAALAGRDDPKSLARLATRAEMRQPGTMERTFGRSGGGMGGMMGGTIFASLVAGFAGSMIANQLFAGLDDADLAAGGADLPADAGQSADTSAGDFADSGADFGGDFGGDI
jgi:hypothetical protein